MRTLTSAQQREVLELFEAALALAEEERAAFITARASAPEVRDGTLALLARHADSESALKTGLPGALGAMDSAVDPPQRLGAYRIERRIARGGMGEVFLGARDAGDFERRVAIKIIRPGILSPDVIERFNRERQILATLEHRHIARLYDGGHTDEGAPYLVMEFIEGRSLSDWLEESTPTLPERLDLLLQICDAVEFAHQNLIVHRDLTPSNVLVTQEGEAKLIDFGIARPQADGGDPAQHSALSGLSLTPGFAAPERQRGAAVTTLSDIYSLGQIMTLMLAPFDEPELRAIAKKASAPAPEARYAGAALMAQDMRRWQQGRVVPAFSTETSYRLRKYLKRNVVSVSLAGAAALALVVGLVLVTSAWRSEARARAEAEQRFDEVRALSNFLLFDLYDELEDVPGATKALNDIADRARHYLDVLSATEGADDEVRLEAALAYKRLSDVLGTPLAANLGRREEAGETLDLAIAQLRALHERAPADEQVMRGLAEALYSKAVYAFIALDDNAMARTNAAEAARLFWQLAEEHDHEEYGRLAIDAEIEAAIPLGWMDRGDEGVALLKQTLSKMEAHVARYGDTPDNLGMLARTLSNLAETAMRAVDVKEDPRPEDYADALGYADRSIAAYRRYVAASDKPDGPRRSMAVSLFKRALTLYGLERWDAAIRDLEEAEAILSQQAALDPEDSGLAQSLAAVREQLAITLAYAGQGSRAMALATRSTEAKRRLYREESNNPGRARNYASNLLLVGEVAEVVGQGAQTCAIYREAKQVYAHVDRLQPLSDYDRDVVLAGVDEALERAC
ncbi:serine/threonine-protein kinase [Aurantiacibacter flavus]|uniref:Protein kinase n=1 Tax=Aurantiacibacter flavus TaxID=3145232 RepID=A0ABV0CU82_9SPHN